MPFSLLSMTEKKKIMLWFILICCWSQTCSIICFVLCEVSIISYLSWYFVISCFILMVIYVFISGCLTSFLCISMAPFPTLTVCSSFVFARSSCVLVSMIQPSFTLSLSSSCKQPVVSLSLGNSFSVRIFALEIIMFCLFACLVILGVGCWIWNLESYVWASFLFCKL